MYDPKLYTEEEAKALVQQALVDIRFAIDSTFGKDSEKAQICVAFIVSILEKMNKGQGLEPTMSVTN